MLATLDPGHSPRVTLWVFGPGQTHQLRPYTATLLRVFSRRMLAGDSEIAQSRRAAPKRALAFIYAFVVLDVLSFGMIIPVFPKLVEQFSGSTASAAGILGVFSASWALMQFLFSPMAGVLSDRFGRRPVLLISCTGLGLDFLLMALAPNLWWLWLGRLISGLTMASFSTSSAYIADMTAPEKRAGAYGMLGAAFGLGFILGPALGGILGSIDLRLPFFLAAAGALANALYGIFVLPESLAPENRAKRFDWRRANPVGALKLLRSHAQLTGLAAVHFCLMLMHNVFPAIFVLYAGYRYGWDELQVGLVLAGVGVCNIIVMGGLVKPVVKRFGERTAVLVGLLSGAIGVTFYAFADTGAMFWFAMPFAALMSLQAPALQGLMFPPLARPSRVRLPPASLPRQRSCRRWRSRPAGRLPSLPPVLPLPSLRSGAVSPASPRWRPAIGRPPIPSPIGEWSARRNARRWAERPRLSADRS